MSENDELKVRLENAAMPQGEYGSRLLDHMNTGEHEQLANWGFEFLPERLAETPGKALDLGCGGGANLMRIRNRYGAEAFGIDHSPISVEKTRQTCADLIAQGACHVQEGDVAALPFEAGTFDLVTAFETVYFWPSLAAGVSEAFRVLAPEGLLFICNETGGSDVTPDWAEPITVYSASELEDALEKAGFAPVQSYAERNGWLCVIGQKPRA